MVYLKIIFYGILSFIERYPLFTALLVLTAIFAPIVWKAIGWVILAIIVLLVIIAGGIALRIHTMRRKMEEQMRSGGAGFSGFDARGFSSGGFNAQGMTLEELVRQMQAQADAQRKAQSGSSTTTTTTSTTQQKRVNDKVGDYVDFEEVE